METKKLSYNRERASSYLKISKEYVSYFEGEMSQSFGDEAMAMLTVKFDAWFYTLTVDERILTYYCESPSFFDWLLRRRKKVEWKLITKDLLLNPPRDGNLRIYNETNI